MRMVKMPADLKHIQDVRATNSVVKSSKPALPTTAILQLQQRHKEKERLSRQQHQIKVRLAYLEKEIAKAYHAAIQTADILRGKEKKGDGAGERHAVKKGRRMVLGY